MRILLIGATGQIGYALMGVLATRGHELSVLVRRRQGLHFPATVRVLEHPVFTPDVFRDALAGVTQVIYGVGLPEQFLFDKTLHRCVNHDLLKTFLAVLRESPIRRLSYLSTYEVFTAENGLIRESHPVVYDTQPLSEYFRVMVEAYRLVRCAAAAGHLQLCTLHPAAVYGGLDTGRGITRYLEDLLERRVWRVPFVVEGRFPVVHVDSLAQAVLASLDRPGAYLVSDQMTSLREMALTLKRHADVVVPATAPLWGATLSVSVLEALAQVSRQTPIMARAQLAFLTQGLEPVTTNARAHLVWTPLPLEEGLQRYLRWRKTRPNALTL